MKPILTCLALFIWTSVHCQQILEGRVVDENNEPIPFVNVGIPNTTVGTCAYEDGTFRLYIPLVQFNSPITFSAIGYLKKQVILDSTQESTLVVKLKESTKILDEIKVTAKLETKIESIGPKSIGVKKRGISISSADGGSAMATRISIADHSIMLKKVNLYIFRNPLDSFTLRCRIQKVNSNNQPGEDLLDRNVFVTSKVENGWITVDLSQYNFAVKEDFYLVFEWIMDKAGSEKVRQNEADPLEWEKPNSTIWNSKVMTYTNDEGEYVRQKLTDKQIAQWKARQFPRTFIGFKKKNGKSSLSFTREQSMASWVEDKHYEMVAYIEYLKFE